MKDFFGKIAWGQNFVTALLTVLGAIAVIHYTDKAPDLVYEAFPPAQFATQETQISIYNARIENIGDKEAEEVQVRFALPPSANIQELKIEVTPSNIPYFVAPPDSNSIRDISFPRLNWGESASFSILVDKGEAAPIGMAVRGKGVIGHTDRNGEPSFLVPGIFVAVVFGLLMGSLLAMVMGKSNRQLLDLMTSQKRVIDAELRITRTKGKTPANKLTEMLTSTTYRLYFNPKVPGLAATKLIRFGAGGNILEGRNNNETTWTIRNDLLELVNSDGKVHSRFYYSPTEDRFFHTGDADTMSVAKHSIGDQFLVPESPVA